MVGVGFGPSNLALAIALAEHNRAGPDCALTSRFIERQARFGWHRGMLIEDATSVFPTRPEFHDYLEWAAGRFEDQVDPGERVWHSCELLHRLPELTAEPRRVVVIGAGQSAAEVTNHLHSTFRRAAVPAIFTRYGYSPADDTAFANRVFDPVAVDHFFVASHRRPGRLRHRLPVHRPVGAARGGGRLAARRRRPTPGPPRLPSQPPAESAR